MCLGFSKSWGGVKAGLDPVVTVGPGSLGIPSFFWASCVLGPPQLFLSPRVMLCRCCQGRMTQTKLLHQPPFP